MFVAVELGLPLMLVRRDLKLLGDVLPLRFEELGGRGGVSPLMMRRNGEQNGLCVVNGCDGSGRSSGDGDAYDDGKDDNDDWNRFLRS